jgi:hypothetical protein
MIFYTMSRLCGQKMCVCVRLVGDGNEPGGEKNRYTGRIKGAMHMSINLGRVARHQFI